MKFSRTIVLCIAALLLASACGSPRHGAEADSELSEPAPLDLVADGEDPPRTGLPDDSGIWDDDTAKQVSDEEIAALVPEVKSDSTPVQPARMSRYNRIGRLNELFNDSNRHQYAVAERLGIKPIRSLSDAYYLSKPLVEISSCRWYDLDTLTHSMPYLVKEGASLLETIGRNFADSLAKRGAPGHKFRVTSVLRTAHSVKKLRRVNRNATDSSTHQFGTTFDISYAHFNHYGGTRLSDEELKYILGEVLWDLRRQNKCMVKYERKSPCFHITATGR